MYCIPSIEEKNSLWPSMSFKHKDAFSCSLPFKGIRHVVEGHSCWMSTLDSCLGIVETNGTTDFEGQRSDVPWQWKKSWESRGVYLGLSPLPVTVANEGLYGSPTKNVIILVVTVTGRGGTTQCIPLMQTPT